ncbi:MAG: amino-acid N-acetyltransferase [Bradymonadia bacterium]
MLPSVFIRAFRQAVPYINAHRGRTFVVYFEGEAVDAPGFRELIHDVALLESLGVHLVMVHGARPQIEAELERIDHQMPLVQGTRVTDAEALVAVKEAVGATRVRIEAMISQGLPGSPMHGARLRVASGNVVVARPLGVRDGVDYQFTGEVRRIDAEGIRGWLSLGNLVLLSPLGYSATGEVFNVRAADVALAVASALKADKLIVLTEDDRLMQIDDAPLRQLDLEQAERWSTDPRLSPSEQRTLRRAVTACEAGVRRIHLVPRTLDGGLMVELFTRDGVGTLISADHYETARRATIRDVAGLLALLRPLEEDGTLVRRSRELLEREIERFQVLDRDGAIVGCAALYPFTDEGLGELACLAVDPEYRGGGRAGLLLSTIEAHARALGLARLCVLTTRTAHWFLEQGFELAEIADLPTQKKRMYNLQRNSKVLMKTL